MLNGYTADWRESLTKSRCINQCFKLGFLYAGLESGYQCFCGDLEPTENRVSDENCRDKCTGDRSRICGGDWKIAVYETDIPDAPTLGRNIGCFDDEGSTRILGDYKVDLEKTNTPRRCMNICYKLGYKYSGVEYGFECFCSHNPPPNARTKPDSHCNTPCPGDPTETCGGGWLISVYRTGLGEVKNDVCEPSLTTYNGIRACKGKQVFFQDFETPISETTWEYTVKFAQEPDYEFVTYNRDKSTISVYDGTLRIKPAILPDELVRNGHLDLGKNCTGKTGTQECSMHAVHYMIFPPVLSSRISTRKSFSFRYGILQFRAKLPLGDWIVPELCLEPKFSKYGPGYRSGRIRVAMSRGNQQLFCDDNDLSSKVLESGVLVGTDDMNVKQISVKRDKNEDWSTRFHNYTVIWARDKISFLVDGQDEQMLMPEGNILREKLGLKPDQMRIWESGSYMAPFDDDFYISIGVSVGGIRDFPDSCISKPWRNYEPKQVANFWKARRSWYQTWDYRHIALEVDDVIVTAL